MCATAGAIYDRRDGMRRITIFGLAGLVLVLMVGALVALQLRSQAGNTARSLPCSPAPCADAGGYRLVVSDVTVQGGTVRMLLTFEVHGLKSMHAQPEDFLLKDGRHIYRPVEGVATPACPAWPRTNIPDGSGLGPKPLCFHPGKAGAALVLNWSPDLGVSEFFSAGYDIRLPRPVSQA